MSDCGGNDTGATEDSSRAPDTSTHYSSSFEPPLDYSTYVAHRETGHSKHSSTHCHPISEHNVAASVTGQNLHDIASSVPFHYVTPESENRHDGYALGSNRYSTQTSYDPFYMADRLTTKRPNLFGKKTIVLRTTDDQNNAGERKISTVLCIGLAVVIFSIVPVVIVIYIFGTPSEFE